MASSRRDGSSTGGTLPGGGPGCTMIGCFDGILGDAGLIFIASLFFAVFFRAGLPAALLFAAFFLAFFADDLFFAGFRGGALVPDFFFVAIGVASRERLQNRLSRQVVLLCESLCSVKNCSKSRLKSKEKGYREEKEKGYREEDG